MPYNNSSTNSFASTPPSSTSSSLLERAKDQDPDAWDRLVDLYGPVLLLWCQQVGLNIHDSGDVVGAVWLAVVKNIVKFRRDRPGDSFRGWLWTITRNEIRNHFHGHEPAPIGGSDWRRILEELPEEAPDSVESGPSDRQLVMRTLMKMVRAECEPHTWQAFWRMTVDKLKASEVAAELGMTEKAVRQAKYRLVRRFRALRTELTGLLD